MTNVHVPKAMLHRDAAIVMRSDPTVGADTGTAVNDRVLVPTVTRGTWRSLSAKEQIEAGQRGTISDAEMAFEPNADIQAGDWVTTMGATWEVVNQDIARSYRRVALRSVKQ